MTTNNAMANQQFLFVLTKSQTPKTELQNQISAKVNSLNLDMNKLKKTNQTGCTYEDYDTEDEDESKEKDQTEDEDETKDEDQTEDEDESEDDDQTEDED